MAKSGKRRRLTDPPPPDAPLSAPNGTRPPAWRRHGWRLLAIWGLLLAAYSNSFQSALVFDNASVIGRDPRIRQATAQNMAAILKGGYRYDRLNDGLYRPLTTFSYLLNYAVLGNGPRPLGYHCVNFALHAVNVALVYALGVLILGAAAPAWALAAVWGLHPLLTESVTNIVGRADLLAAFGVLAGLLCHIRGASAEGRTRLAWLAGLAAAQAVGLFSKESAAILPGLLLLYDLSNPERAPWRQRASSYAALVAPFAAFAWLRLQIPNHLTVAFTDNPLATAGFLTARLTAVRVLGKLLLLFVWPARLSADYSYNTLPVFGRGASMMGDATAIAALAIGVCAAAWAARLAIRKNRENRPLLFFLALALVSALPTSNLIILIGSIMAERFLYLPSVGLAGFAVAAVYLISRRFPKLQSSAVRVAWGALGIVCLTLAARTYARNADWKDELSLWSSAVEVSPGSSKAHYNLAKALEVIPGRLPDAISEYRAALRIYPADVEAHTNLGNALAKTPGGEPEAISEYQAALRINPNSAEPHNGQANVLAGLPGRLQDAIAEYQAALRIQPENPELHYNLANALFHAPGKLPDSITEYQEALRLDPEHSDARINLGNALASIPGRSAEAIDEYRKALRINPNLVRAHINLANALSVLPGRLQEAVAEYQAAQRIQPDNAEVNYDLGSALARIPGRLPEAVAAFQMALSVQPDFFEARVNLATALAEIPGRTAEAASEFERALRIRPDPAVRQMLDRLRTRR